MAQLYALAQCRQPAAGRQHGRGDILNEKTSFNPSPGKAMTERREILKTYELLIYEDRHYITTSFCRNMLRVTTLGQSCPHHIKRLSRPALAYLFQPAEHH